MRAAAAAASGVSAPAGGRFHRGCAPHCRRRKVRSAPFPPAAKTAPAPLLLLSPPRGARRGPRIETSKRKCAAPGGKEKMFGGSGRIYASLLPPAGESWHFLVEVRDGNARPLGKSFGPGKYKDTSCADFRCRWPVVDESCSIGQGNSFCEHRAARSEAERAERGAGQMRPCTPTQDAPSATGRQCRLRRRE